MSNIREASLLLCRAPDRSVPSSRSSKSDNPTQNSATAEAGSQPMTHANLPLGFLSQFCPGGREVVVWLGV